jgi:H/ACA ribonucleoprotein complex non-core subunit NAF1
MSVDIHSTFKVPESIPQDLLLIQELVGEVSISQSTNTQKASLSQKTEVEEDDIGSSGSEDNSEDELDEVEAGLVVIEEENDGDPIKA